MVKNEKRGGYLSLNKTKRDRYQTDPAFVQFFFYTNYCVFAAKTACAAGAVTAGAAACSALIFAA